MSINMKINEEKGITLVALVITVVILTILGASTLTIVNNTQKSSQDTREKAELNMIQQLILERYTKYTLTKDSDILIGKKFGDSSDSSEPSTEYDKLPYQLEYISPIGNIENETNVEKYYYMIYGEYLAKLGIDNTTNIYIVNYYTGEVMQLDTEETTDETGKYIIKENTENTNYIVLKEDNGKYVIKQTEEGELLYTYARNKT